MSESKLPDNLGDFLEVMVPVADGTEFFYWVETDDEDAAIATARKKHAELKRPEPNSDDDEDNPPVAYEVIEDNHEQATIIYQTDVVEPDDD